jgi:hypothetical protein
LKEGFMLKKSLIFGSVALFLAALITLMGCPTEAESDSGGGTYKHRIYGKAVDSYAVQEIIDKAIALGEPVILEDGLTITGGQIDFKTATVTINGTVNGSDSGLVINAADAKVTYDGMITPDSYIYSGEAPTAAVPGGALVQYVDSLDKIMPTATAAAVRNFKLGSKVNYDYSTGTETYARITAPGLETLYVLGNLEIPLDGVAPGADSNNSVKLKIEALGTVDVTGTSSSVFTSDNLVLGASSTLTSTKGGVVLTFPDVTIIPRIKVDNGKAIKILGTEGPFEIAAKLEGDGTLEVAGTIDGAISIGTDYVAPGSGNILFSGITSDVTKITTRSTGTITFGSDLGLSGDSAIVGDVVFKEDVTTNGKLYFGGNVTLANGKEITLGGTDTLTLAPGKTISVGGGTYTDAVPVPAVPVLAAGVAGVTLTPATGASLTAPSAIKSTDTDEKKAAVIKLTLEDADLTITNGTLQVAKGGIFGIAENYKVITDFNSGKATAGYLAIADGGTISLPDVDSKIQVGPKDSDAKIIGASASTTLKVSGGTVTLGNNVIKGDTEGTKLAVAGSDAGITIGDSTGGQVLTLSKVDLDLATRGILTITGASAFNSLVLTDKAKLTLGTGDVKNVTPRKKISGLSITGDFVAETSSAVTEAGTGNQNVFSLSHGGGADVSVIGPVADGSEVVLKKGARFTP